jgi:chromosome segregation ATPase
VGDQAAAKATPAAQLRWVSIRAQLVKENQAKKDAERHDALESANKRLQESIAEFERTQQNIQNELRNKDRDLVAARNENGEMAAKLKEMSNERAKQVGELTNNVRTTQRKAEGLLALVRCVCLQMEQYSEGRRIQYAARLMQFSDQALKKAQQLAVLVNDPEAHRKAYADICWNAASGPIGQSLTSVRSGQENAGGDA